MCCSHLHHPSVVLRCLQKTINVVLSPQDLVSCDHEMLGCDGGVPHLAMDYMEFHGIRTMECIPYHSGSSGKRGTCPHTCANATVSDKRYKVKMLSAKGLHTEEEIQTAIMTGGPVEGAFAVYADLMAYKSGVYKHTGGKFLGLHAIKMIGWGVSETGVKFWRIANSWGTSFGLDGFFLMIRGENDCGIETFGAVSALPDLENQE
eukprot:TRINITY_DN3728_c1_g2_i1.p1 TRINITY_DN3728_c1_g2~~TRINITY_DN3728_c1_g2_i1.p1  ORF type:complete len:205 (+),score=37.14 TRINITY_DN3728_c1_g2_i1:253-867(+)